MPEFSGVVVELTERSQGRVIVINQLLKGRVVNRRRIAGHFFRRGSQKVTPGLVTAHRKGNICEETAHKRGECNCWSPRELHRDEIFKINRAMDRNHQRRSREDGHIKLLYRACKEQGIASA